tara:strand:- start:968 stop:1123 length:156 start_codon:yes stop_codon:yes gene_type:complete
MILVLDKATRDLLGVADTIKEAKDLRKGRINSTVTEVCGSAGYKTRYKRAV